MHTFLYKASFLKACFASLIEEKVLNYVVIHAQHLLIAPSAKTLSPLPGSHGMGVTAGGVER